MLLKDSVRETTTSTGTGDLVLSGSAPDGFRTVSGASFTDGETAPWRIETDDRSEWELGRYPWDSGTNTLQRSGQTPIASSNSGALVNFSSGSKTVTIVDDALANYVPKHSLAVDANGLASLVNDSASPGANQVYGTNGSGTKGWKADPAGGSGDAWSDPVDADIVPDADGTRDLGSNATRFAEAYSDVVVTDLVRSQTAIAEGGFSTSKPLVVAPASVNLHSYKDVVSYQSNSPTVTGTMKITLPKGDSGTMLTVTIKGWNYAPNENLGYWELTISGRLFSSAAWHGYGAEVQGNPPFSSVRLATESGKRVILLGTTSSTWNYPAVRVADVMTSFSSFTDWDTGWSISVVSSETGITNIVTPTPQRREVIVKTFPTAVPAGNDNTPNSYIYTRPDGLVRTRFGQLDLTATQSIPNDRPAYIQPSFHSASGPHYSLLLCPLGGRIGIGNQNPSDRLHVKQSDTSAAHAVAKLEQLDQDEEFIDLTGTSAADATKSLSSLTGGNSVQGFFRVEVNGTDRWVPFYDAPTT